MPWKKVTSQMTQSRILPFFDPISGTPDVSQFLQFLCPVLDSVDWWQLRPAAALNLNPCEELRSDLELRVSSVWPHTRLSLKRCRWNSGFPMSDLTRCLSTLLNLQMPLQINLWVIYLSQDSLHPKIVSSVLFWCSLHIFSALWGKVPSHFNISCNDS